MRINKIIGTTLLLTTFLFSLSATADQSSAKIMKEVARQAQDGIPNDGEKINGVILSSIKRTPKFSAGLVRTLKKLEKDTLSTYMEALKDAEADLNCTLKEAREDIRLCLPEGAIQIGERYTASVNGEVVGYVLEIYDNADAAIIQDGSWIIIYLDKNMNVVDIYRGQS